MELNLDLILNMDEILRVDVEETVQALSSDAKKLQDELSKFTI